MKRFLAPLGLVLLLTGPAAPAAATEFDRSLSCLKQDTLGSYLARAFKESRIASGALEDGTPIELFAARDGSWTMVELTADGYGCIRSYGHGLQVERENAPKRPAS